MNSHAFTWNPSRLARVALVLLLPFLLVGCAAMRRPHSPLETSNVQSFKLSNGLTVFALESHAVPLVTLDMWVRVGAKDEPAEIAGISHFLEHMMFKGTPRLGVGDYDRRIEELGGYLNAATSTDYTHYYLTVPSEHLETALEDMVDVMLNSSFDPVEVGRERAVILEEIRQKQDNPLGFLYDEVTRSVFVSGPYAHTVIGSEDTVSGMTRDQLVEHYQRFYAPENMAFVVVGDFDFNRLRRLIEDHFGGMRRDLRPWRETDPETEFTQPQQRNWERDWQQTYFFVTFPGNEVATLKEMAAVDVAEAILVGGRSSRLVNSLREKRRLVTSISGFFHSNRHPSFMAIHGSTPNDNMPAIIDALFEELDRVREDGPRSGEIRRAKRQIINDHLYQAETNTGKASLIGYSFARLGDLSLLHEYPEAVRDVSEPEVRRVIDLMTRERASIFTTKPAYAASAK